MSDNPFERRQAERRSVLNFLDYEVLAADGEVIGRGLARTLNVSSTGLLLETGQFFDAGQPLRITLALADELVQLTGRVVHAEPVGDEMCSAGVQFVSFDPADQDIFRHYCDFLQQHAGQR